MSTNTEIKTWRSTEEASRISTSWDAVALADREIAELRAALVAAPVPQQAAGDARQRQVLHDLAIAAVERWVAAEFKNAKNLGAGGPSERNDMERAARRAIAALADSIPSEGEQQ